MDDKDFYVRMIACAKQRRDKLAPASHVRQALSDEILDTLITRIDASLASELDFGPWPPILGWLNNVDDASVVALDDDITAILKSSKPDRANDGPTFLRSQFSREFVGGLFETWVKSACLDCRWPTEFDVPIPDGSRDCDVRVAINGRPVRLECTVLTEDDESRMVFERFVELKKTDPNAILVRPGPLCPPNAKGPSPYYDARRFYAKIYDKLALQLDPARTQCAINEPNLLLVSISGISPSELGLHWALDELFAAQPRGWISALNVPDVSLEGWLNHEAKCQMARGSLTLDAWIASYQKLMQAPRKLAGVLIFKRCRLVHARLNYNAAATCAMSHAQMAEIEQILGTPPEYDLS